MLLIIRKRSQRKILNKRGSNMEPCRTPNKNSSHELYSTLILVLCFRFEKYFCISLKAAVLNPHALSFANKRSCERQQMLLKDLWGEHQILFCYKQFISLSQALAVGYALRWNLFWIHINIWKEIVQNILGFV